MELQRYERIRVSLRNRFKKLAEKEGIRFGSSNHYTDMSNLLGASLECLDEYFTKNQEHHLKSLWAARKYLKLIEKYPNYKEAEKEEFSTVDSITGAFPDIMESLRNDEFAKRIYVWKSAERLEAQSS